MTVACASMHQWSCMHLHGQHPAEALLSTYGRSRVRFSSSTHSCEASICTNWIIFDKAV